MAEEIKLTGLREEIRVAIGKLAGVQLEPTTVSRLCVHVYGDLVVSERVAANTPHKVY